jgi:hypothetical protein
MKAIGRMHAASQRAQHDRERAPDEEPGAQPAPRLGLKLQILRSPPTSSDPTRYRAHIAPSTKPNASVRANVV